MPPAHLFEGEAVLALLLAPPKDLERDILPCSELTHHRCEIGHGYFCHVIEETLRRGPEHLCHVVIRSEEHKVIAPIGDVLSEDHMCQKSGAEVACIP